MDESPVEDDRQRARFHSPWGLGIGAAVAAVALSAFTLRRTIEITFDGWVYWQGSVSLLKGLGYRDFYDLPIDLWPPLYSIYLSGWQAVLGISGSSLITANVVAAGAAAIAWVVTFDRLARELAPATGRIRRLAPATALVVVLVARNSTVLLSESIYIALFPLALISADAARTAGDLRRYLRACAALCITLGLCLLSRNSALAVVPPLVALAGANRVVGLRWRLLGAGAGGVLPVAAWQGCRAWLGQVSAQPVGLGMGRYEFLEYVAQAIGAVNELLLPFGGGALLAVALLLPFRSVLLSPPGSSLRSHLSGEPGVVQASRRWSLFCLGSVGGLIAIFLMTDVFDPLGARHILPLTLLGAGCVAIVSSAAHPAVRVGVAALVLAFPLAHVVQQAVVGVGPKRPTWDGQVAFRYVPHDLRIFPTRGTGGLMIRGDGARIMQPIDRRDRVAARQRAREAAAAAEQ